MDDGVLVADREQIDEATPNSLSHPLQLLVLVLALGTQAVRRRLESDTERQ